MTNRQETCTDTIRILSHARCKITRKSEFYAYSRSDPEPLGCNRTGVQFWRVGTMSVPSDIRELFAMAGPVLRHGIHMIGLH